MSGTGDSDPARLVAVYAAPNEMMAELVRGTLEAEGIPAVISQRVTQAYASLLQLAEGFAGEVCVAARDEERARIMLSGFDEGWGRISEEELAEAAEKTAPDGLEER